MRRVGLAGLAVLALLTAVRGPYHDAASARLLAALPSAEGARVYALSDSMRVGSPIAAGLNGIWCSRYPTLWTLAGAHAQLAKPAEAAAARLVISQTRDNVVEDFERCRPDLVIVERERSPNWPSGFDYLAFMRADARFTTLWGGFERQQVVGRFEIWRDRGGSHASER